ncbi:EIF3I [Cordylochernes scorpioides]|uniref:Serine-threonine kinase receptor-associated protein n=1 Tax=Cordylochernes scorpioides TaxID=51811 RepID=A0ABY6KNM0_9ARAC|nr:EIF3I [Cordylochernes scorpioides]
MWFPGKMLSAIETKTAVRSCSFSYSGKMVLYTTDKSLGKTCEINIIDLNQQLQNVPQGHIVSGAAQSTILNIPVPTSKVSSAIWGPLDQSIITGHENGDIIQWDIRTGKKMLLVQEHKDVINDLQYSKDELMFITASKDHTAKLFDVSTMKPLKVYKTERPVNSGAISPIADHVIVAGGQEAMDVTTTSARQGKFDARFFHLIFEEEFGRIKDHFGPINSVAFHPDGKSYSSGGEDGYVRTHTFDPAYFEFDFEY